MGFFLMSSLGKIRLVTGWQPLKLWGIFNLEHKFPKHTLNWKWGCLQKKDGESLFSNMLRSAGLRNIFFFLSIITTGIFRTLKMLMNIAKLHKEVTVYNTIFNYLIKYFSHEESSLKNFFYIWINLFLIGG